LWYDGTRHVRLIRNFRIGTSLSNRIRIGTSDSNSNRIRKLRRSLDLRRRLVSNVGKNNIILLSWITNEQKNTEHERRENTKISSVVTNTSTIVFKYFSKYCNCSLWSIFKYYLNTQILMLVFKYLLRVFKYLTTAYNNHPVKKYAMSLLCTY